MIINDKPIGLSRGLTRKSVLDVVGRKLEVLPDGTIKENCLLVDYNGSIQMVRAGFFGHVDMLSPIAKKAIIIHMVIDERSEKECLRFPVFKGFYYE